MRFWITRNSGLPIREQLVRQVLLGILSDDLPAGYKLPSVRALARRHHIHANTISAAYHDLLERGWLELRRGSGLYVRSLEAASGEQDQLDGSLSALLKAASALGLSPEDVLHRLEHIVRPRRYDRILVAEQEPALRDIVIAEISESLSVSVEPFDISKYAKCEAAVVTALAGRIARFPGLLPKGIFCVPLRLRSVRGSVEGQRRPGLHEMVSIISRSEEIRRSARAMLIAVGVDSECLLEISPSETGWRNRLGLSAMIITDVVAARELPAGFEPRVFRVVSDASVAELRRYFPSP